MTVQDNKDGQNIQIKPKETKIRTNQVNKIKYITKDNPIILKTDGIIKQHISKFHTNNALKSLSPTTFFWTVYKRNRNLKQMIASSSYPKKIKNGDKQYFKV